MRTMRRIDDFLIDKMFQPCVDRLSPSVSPYALAAFLMTGACLLLSGLAVWRHALVSCLIWAVWIPWTLVRVYQQERSPPSNTMPIARVRFLFFRVILLFIQIGNVPALVFGSRDTIGLIDKMALSMVLVAEYLMACHYRPPMRRVRRVGWSLLNARASVIDR